ncbi:MAG: hypothetical protein AB1716_07980 [Planctomycetota bacterium]
MRGKWLRVQRRVALLATGGVTLGVLQGLEMVNFAWLFAEFLIRLLSTIVVALLGGSVDSLTGLGGIFGGTGGTGTTGAV